MSYRKALTRQGMFYTSRNMEQIAASHQDVIERAGGPAKFARAIGADPNTVKAWKRGNSIPAPYWQAVAGAELATLDELADAAARKVALVDAMRADAAHVTSTEAESA